MASSEGGLSTRPKTATLAVLLAFVVVSLVATYLKPRPVLGSPDFNLDNAFGIPSPPDIPYPVKGNQIAGWVMTVFGSTGVAQGCYEAWKTKSTLPIGLGFSGLFIAIPEVFYDVIGCVYFPVAPGHVAYGFLGREMPWWILAGWWGYGGFLVFNLTLLEANPKNKTLWIFWIAAGLSSVIFEEALLSLGVYHYYGNQPLILLWRLPWWWVPCNSLGVFLATALAFRYRDHLKGWRAVFVLALTPMSVTAVYGFIAMPSWIAVNGNLGWLPTQLLGLLTVFLGFAAFPIVVESILDRDPFDLHGRSRTGKLAGRDEETSRLLG